MKENKILTLKEAGVLYLDNGITVDYDGYETVKIHLKDGTEIVVDGSSCELCDVPFIEINGVSLFIGGYVN